MANTNKTKNSNLTESTTSTKRKSNKNTVATSTTAIAKKETVKPKAKSTAKAKTSTATTSKTTKAKSTATAQVSATTKAKTSTTAKTKASATTKAKTGTTAKTKASTTTKAKTKASTTTKTKASATAKTKVTATKTNKKAKTTKATTKSKASVVIPAPTVDTTVLDQLLEISVVAAKNRDKRSIKNSVSSTTTDTVNSSTTNVNSIDAVSKPAVSPNDHDQTVTSNSSSQVNGQDKNSHLVPLPKLLSPVTSLVLSKQAQIRVDNSEAHNSHGNSTNDQHSDSNAEAVKSADDQALTQLAQQHRDDPIALEAKYQQELTEIIAKLKAHYQQLRKSDQYRILAYEYGYTNAQCADFYACELLRALANCNFEKIGVHGVNNQFYAESLSHIEEQYSPLVKKNRLNLASLYTMWFHTYIDEMPIQTRIQFLTLISHPYFKNSGLDIDEYEKYLAQKTKKLKERHANRQQRNLARRSIVETGQKTSSADATTSTVSHSATSSTVNSDPVATSTVANTVVATDSNSLTTTDSQPNPFKQAIKSTKVYMALLVEDFVQKLASFYLQNLNADNFIDLNLWSFVEGVRAIEYAQIQELKEKIESLLTTDTEHANIYQQQLDYLANKSSFINEDLEFCENYLPQVDAQGLYREQSRLNSLSLSKLFTYYPMLKTLPLFEVYKVDNISVFEFVVAFTTCQVVYNNPTYRQLAQSHGIDLPQAGLNFLGDADGKLEFTNLINKNSPYFDNEVKTALEQIRHNFHNLVQNTKSAITDFNTNSSEQNTSHATTNASSNSSENSLESQELNRTENATDLATEVKPVTFTKLSDHASSSFDQELTKHLVIQPAQDKTDPTMVECLFGWEIPALKPNQTLANQNYLERYELLRTKGLLNDLYYQDCIENFLKDKSEITLYTFVKNYKQVFSNFNQAKFDQHLAQITFPNEQVLGLEYCLVGRNFLLNRPYFSNLRPSSVITNLIEVEYLHYKELLEQEQELKKQIVRLQNEDQANVTSAQTEPTTLDQTVTPDQVQVNNQTIVPDQAVATEQTPAPASEQDQVKATNSTNVSPLTNNASTNTSTSVNDNSAEIRRVEIELQEVELDLQKIPKPQIDLNQTFTPTVKHIKFANGTDLTVTAFAQDEHNLGLNSTIYQKYFGYRAFKYFPNGTFIELLGLPSAQVQSSTYLNAQTQVNYNNLTNQEALDQELLSMIDDSDYGSFQALLHFENCVNEFQQTGKPLHRTTYKAYDMARLSVPALQISNLGISLVTKHKDLFGISEFDRTSELYDQLYDKVAGLFLQYNINSSRRAEFLKNLLDEFIEFVTKNASTEVQDVVSDNLYRSYINDLVKPIIDCLTNDKKFLEQINAQANMRKADNQVGVNFNYLVSTAGLTDLVKDKLNLYQTLPNCYSLEELKARHQAQAQKQEQEQAQEPDQATQPTATTVPAEQLIANQLVFQPGNFLNRDCSDLLFLFLANLGFLGSLEDNIHIVTALPCPNPYYGGLTALVLAGLVQRNHLRQKLNLSKLAFPIFEFSEKSPQTSYQALKEQSLAGFDFPYYLQTLTQCDSWYPDLGYSRLAPLALMPIELKAKLENLAFGKPHATFGDVNNFVNVDYFYSEQTCLEILKHNYISTNDYLEQVNDPKNHLSPEYIALDFIRGLYQHARKVYADKHRVPVTPELIETFFHNKVKASLANFQSLTTEEDFNLIINSITKDYIDNFNRQDFDLDSLINDPLTHEAIDVTAVPNLNLVIEALTKVAFGGREELKINRTHFEQKLLTELGTDEAIYTLYQGNLNFDLPSAYDWEDLAHQTIDLFSFIADKSADLISSKFNHYVGLGTDPKASLDSIKANRYRLLEQAKEELTNIPALAASILALVELDPVIGGKVNYELGLDFMLQAALGRHPFAMAYMAKFFAQAKDFYDSRVTQAPTLPERVAILDQLYDDLYPQIKQALDCKTSVTIHTPEIVQFLESYYQVKRQYLAFIQARIHQANKDYYDCVDRIIPVLEEKAELESHSGSNSKAKANSNTIVDNDGAYSPELIAKAKAAVGVNSDDKGYSQLQARRSRQHKEEMDLKAERLYREIYSLLQLKVNLLQEYNRVEEGLDTLVTNSNLNLTLDIVKATQARTNTAETFTKESFTRLSYLAEDISLLSAGHNDFPLNYKEAEDYLTHYAFYCTDSSARNFYFDKFAEVNLINEQFAYFRKEFADISLDKSTIKAVHEAFNYENVTDELSVKVVTVVDQIKQNSNSDEILSDPELDQATLVQQVIKTYSETLQKPSSSLQGESLFFSDVKLKETTANKSKAKPKKAKRQAVFAPYDNLEDLASKSLETIYLEQMANLKRQFVICYEQNEDPLSTEYLKSTQTAETILSPFEIGEVSVEDKYDDQAFILNALEQYPNYIGDYFRLIGDMFNQRTQKFTSQYAFLVTDKPAYELSLTATNRQDQEACPYFSDLEASYLLAPNLTINTLVTNLMNSHDTKLFDSYQSPRGRVVLGKKLNAYIAFFINKCNLLAPANLHLLSDHDNAQARYFSDLVDYLTLAETFRADQFNTYEPAQEIGEQSATELQVKSYLPAQDLSQCYSSIQGNPLIYAQEQLDFTQAEQTAAKIEVANHLSGVLFNFYQICQYLDTVRPLTTKDVKMWVKGNYPLNSQQLEQFSNSFNRLVDLNYNNPNLTDQQQFISFKLVDSVKSLFGTNNYPVRIFNLEVLLSDRYLTATEVKDYASLIDIVKTSRQAQLSPTAEGSQLTASVYNSTLEANYSYQIELGQQLESQLPSFKQAVEQLALPSQFTYALRWKIVDHLFRVATSEFCPRNYDARIYYGVYNLLASPYLNSLDTSIALLERNDVPNQTQFGFNQLILGLLYALKSCDLATSELRYNSLNTTSTADCLDVFIPTDKSQNQVFLPASSYRIDHDSFKVKALATLERASEISSHWMPKFVLGLVYRSGLLGAKVDMRRGKDLMISSLMILNATEVQFTLKSKVSILIQSYLSEVLPQELANANDFDLIKIVRSFDMAWFAEMISVDSLNLETLIYTWTV